MTAHTSVAAPCREAGLALVPQQANAPRAPFFKRLVHAVLAAASMFHGPGFGPDPDPPEAR